MYIEPFTYRYASLESYRAYNSLKETLRAEFLPDAAPTLLEERIRRLQNPPEYQDMDIWVVWNDDCSQMIASAECILLHTPENQHVMPFAIGVHPAHRRQGLATQLLAKVATVAQREKRHLLMTTTFGSTPLSATLLARLGATPGLATHLEKLNLAEVDRKLLQLWQQPDPLVVAEFELGIWYGPFPEEELPEIAQLLAVLNDQPTDELSLEDVRYTPERVREMDRAALSEQSERWVMYARERQTGRLVGFTAVHFHPSRPHEVGQGETGVFPQYRRRGIGRWLKATMLEKILQERPEARAIFTSNADSNAAILKINRAMGYKPTISQCLWQVKLAVVQTYLQARAFKNQTDSSQMNQHANYESAHH